VLSNCSLFFAFWWQADQCVPGDLCIWCFCHIVAYFMPSDDSKISVYLVFLVSDVSCMLILLLTLVWLITWHTARHLLDLKFSLTCFRSITCMKEATCEVGLYSSFYLLVIRGVLNAGFVVFLTLDKALSSWKDWHLVE